MRKMKKFTRNVLALSSLCLCLPVLAENNKTQIIVKFTPGVSSQNKNHLIDRIGAEKASTLFQEKVHILSVPEHAAHAIINALSNSKQVEFAQLDQLNDLNASPNDPLINSQWYIPKLRAQQAWDYAVANGLPNETVLVSAPDTGMLANHEDLQDILRMDLSYNSVDGTADSSPIHSHGTGTAGMLSADTNNGLGIASVMWASSAHHIPIRVSNLTSGSAYSTDIARAVEYAVDNGAKVVSVSYSGVGEYIRREAGAYAQERGALLFNSAGNDGGYRDFHQGKNWNEIIAVSSTTSSDSLSSFSSYGPYVDIAAPGSSDYTTNWSSSSAYGYASGTSFSSPLAASVAAMLFSTYPNADPLQVEQALYDGAVDLGDAGWDERFGHGRVDAYGSLLALESIMNTSENNIPEVSFVNPAANQVISENINIDVLATDDTAVDYVDLYIDGVYHATDQLQDNDHFVFNWDVSTYANASYQLSVDAVDIYGNSATTTLTVVLYKPQLAQPSISISNLTEGQCVKGTFAVEVETSNTQSVDFSKSSSYLGTSVREPFTYNYSFRSKGKPKSVFVSAVAWNANLSAADSVSVIDGGCDNGESNDPKPAKCSDGVDNDRDGLIDYPNDPQCSGPGDNNERR